MSLETRSPALSANMVSVQSLGSGSSGNALLIASGETTIMVDCGVGIRSIRSALAAFGRNISDLDALLITHEHSDHVRTVPQVMRLDLPIVATAGTAGAARLPRAQTQVIVRNTPVDVAGATVHALPVRHDATEPCGFLIEIGGVAITVLTDLGTWQDHLAEAAMASDLVLLEANYNDEMLRHGPYPAYLKRRVASGKGHLANAACGRAIAPIARLRGSRTTWWLSHLSATNNSPNQALADVREHVHRQDIDMPIVALPRKEAGPRWTSPMRSTRTGESHDLSVQLGMPGLD